MGGAAASLLGGAATEGAAGIASQSLGSMAMDFARDQIMSNPIGSGLSTIAKGGSFSDGLARTLHDAAGQGDDDEMQKRKKQMLKEGESATDSAVSQPNPYLSLMNSKDWQQYIN